ncbi:MAG: hypothetical protein ACK57B_14550 [Betaproteobacteria bacterium]
MPRLFCSRWTPLPRLALMAALALLLCAQFLLLAHAGEHAHGDEGHDHDEPGCALCLFQAAGQSAVSPLAEPPAMALRLWPRLRPQAQPTCLRAQDGWPLLAAARGPPGAEHRA